MEFAIMFLKLVISLSIVLLLMFLTFKFAGKGVSKVNGDKYIKVIDRVQISKDSYIIILKVGKEGWIMSSSGGKSEKLKDLSEEEINEIENKKKESMEEINKYYVNILEKSKELKNKAIKKLKSKEDSNEK